MIAPPIDCDQIKTVADELIDAGYCQEVVQFCDEVPINLDDSIGNDGFLRMGRESGDSVTCPSDALVGDMTGNACICPSGSAMWETEGLCTPFDVPAKCPGGALPTPAEDEESDAQPTLTGLFVMRDNPDHNLVLSFTVHIPMVDGRYFTEVGLSGPGPNATVEPGCDAASAFTL